MVPAAATEGFLFADRRCLLLAAGGRAMRGLLGEKIGEGATADIHVWAPGQIVKLFKVGTSPRFGRHEARMTRAAFAAGARTCARRSEFFQSRARAAVAERFRGLEVENQIASNVPHAASTAPMS